MSSTSNKPEQPSAKTSKKGINPLVIMLLVFGLPYAIAWYFLYDGDPTEFEAPSNNGVIISPMIKLPSYILEEENGQKIRSESLANKWLLFTVSKTCNEACKRTLLVIRQARKAMAVDRDAIKPILLLHTPDALKKLDINLAQEFSTLSIATAESTQSSGLIDIFSSSVDELENAIFMVDPFGNFMMAYPADSDQLGLLDDMKRLLKVNPVHR